MEIQKFQIKEKIMFKKALIASAVALAVSAPAHALVQVSNFDWTTPFGTFNDIAYINMSALGNATVKQEVNGSGNVFVGAKFSEFGAGFSATYVDKNLNPGFFGQTIWFDFIGLSGSVTALTNTGGFQYKFDPTGLIMVSYGPTKALAQAWFNSPVVGINGSTFGNIGLNIQGTSEILSVAVPGAGTFKDEANQPLDWFQNNFGLFFDVVTTNTIRTAGASFDCDGTGPSTQQCRNLGVQSSGDITLYRIPEPASLALVGLGLLGAGVARRRKVVAN